MFVYITGVPGSGKSSVCAELQARGYTSVDGDDHIGAWVSRETGETLAAPPEFASRTPEFYERHSWLYPRRRQVRDLMTKLDDQSAGTGRARGKPALGTIPPAGLF